MTVSIIIQHQEDSPRNPGWWRFSRPVHMVLDEPPEIRETIRWWYGTAADAAQAQAEWDARHR